MAPLCYILITIIMGQISPISRVCQSLFQMVISLFWGTGPWLRCLHVIFTNAEANYPWTTSIKHGRIVLTMGIYTRKCGLHIEMGAWFGSAFKFWTIFILSFCASKPCEKWFIRVVQHTHFMTSKSMGNHVPIKRASYVVWSTAI